MKGGAGGKGRVKGMQKNVKGDDSRKRGRTGQWGKEERSEEYKTADN